MTGALGAVALLASGPPTAPRPRSGEAATPSTGAFRWRDPNAQASLAGQSTTDLTYTSAVCESPGQFNALGALLTGSASRIELRASSDGDAWTDWRDVTEPGETARDGRRASALLTGTGWRFAQYRVTVSGGQPSPDVELVLVDSATGGRVEPLSAEPAASAQVAGQPAIISRAGWGCDENLPANNGVSPWPPEYRTIQKGIIHHTATSNDYPDAPAVVRAIYYYHAITLEWADIGYNYLVDRWGNIYEGRAGGRGVVGGHALQYNWGSVGVACLGNFNDATPTAEMLNALASVVAWSCSGIDPRGQAWFVDDVYPNVGGHRYFMSTECPGTNLYASLPALRDRVQAKMSCAAGAAAAAPAGPAVASVDSTTYTNRVYLPLVARPDEACY
jgi:hypothetical protein